MQPDENAYRGHLERTGFEVYSRESLSDVMGDIGSVIHGPADACGGNQWADLFFYIGFHGDRNRPTEFYVVQS